MNVEEILTMYKTILEKIFNCKFTWNKEGDGRYALDLDFRSLTFRYTYILSEQQMLDYHKDDFICVCNDVCKTLLLQELPSEEIN